MPQFDPALRPAGQRRFDEIPDPFQTALSSLSLAKDGVAEVMRAAIVRCFTDSGLQNPELAAILVRRSAPRDLATLLGAVFSALDPQATEKQEHLRALLQRAVALDSRYGQLLSDHVNGRAHAVGPGAMRLVRRSSVAAAATEDWTEEAGALELALQVWCSSLGEAAPAPEASGESDLAAPADGANANDPATPEAQQAKASDPVTSPTVVEEPGNPVAARWLDAWNRHDAERVRSVFANGGVYIDSGLDHELSGAIIASHVSRIFKEYPDFALEHVRGEHLDPHTWAGLWTLRAGRNRDGQPRLSLSNLALRVGVFLRIRDDRVQAAHMDFDLDPDGDGAAVFSQDAGRRQRAREVAEHLQERVSHLLEEERAFLDNKLSLAGVAEQLSTSPHHLSRVLHSATGGGLHALLVQMRLDEAERLLASPSADTTVLEEIATRVGFRSSSAFRLAFKDRTGMTPGRYRRERAGSFEL